MPGRSYRFLLVIGVVALALLARWRAAALSWPLADEQALLETAQGVAAAIETEGLAAAIKAAPPPRAVPLLTGIALSLLPADAQLMEGLAAGRAVSALLGCGHVLLVALVDPLAGLFMALASTHIRFTAGMVLDVWPALAATAAVLAFARAREAANGWFWLAAVLAGLAAAGGGYQSIALLAILPWLIVYHRRQPRHILLFGLAFLVASSLAMWWGPAPDRRYLLNLTVPSGYRPNPFLLRPDPLFLLLGLGGLPLLWQREKRYAAWLGAGLLALTPLALAGRWPAAALLLAAPLALSAAALVRHGAYLLSTEVATWPDLWARLKPVKGFWFALAAVTMGLAAISTWVELEHRRQWQAWPRYDVTAAPLLESGVNAVLPLGGQVLFATDRGLLRLDWEGDWALAYDRGQWTGVPLADLGLASQQATTLARDADGRLWLGTSRGVALQRHDGWQVWDGADLGLATGVIRQILAEPASERVWVATGAGAAVYDGVGWQAYTQENSEIPHGRIHALAARPGQVWFATPYGVGILSLGDDTWRFISGREAGLTSDGVNAIGFDPKGRVWLAGPGGVAACDGESWRAFTAANSGLTSNTVTELAIGPDGRVWAGLELADGAGGAVAVYDPDTDDWRSYGADNSGFEGDAILALVEDGRGRLWIGTRAAGVYAHDTDRPGD